jgi:hypothetical protein
LGTSDAVVAATHASVRSDTGSSSLSNTVSISAPTRDRHTRIFPPAA